MSTSFASTADPGPVPLIPIVLGVVGHRDVREIDKPALRQALQKIYAEFDDAYPKSPKVLLSPLAPGADQIAAEMALFVDGDRSKPRANWSVRAPLPMPPDDLRKCTSFRFNHMKDKDRNPDGIDAAGLAQFDELMANPRVEWFVVPLPPKMTIGGWVVHGGGKAWRFVPPEGEAPEEPMDWEKMLTVSKEVAPSHAAFRNACYANPGGYIVRHCHTLIALWDKVDVINPSGTAEIVKFQLSGQAPEFYPWNDVAPLGFDGDRGPVIWLPTPRHDSDVAATKDIERIMLVPSPTDGMYFGETVEIGKVARRVKRGERFWARCWQGWGHKEAAPPVPPKGAFPGPWHPEAIRTHCPEYNQFLWVCQTIEDFNQEADELYRSRAQDKKYEEALQKADHDAAINFPAADTPLTDQTKIPLGEWNRRFLRVQATASRLAGQLAPRHENLMWWIFGLLVVALLFFHIYAHPFWHFDHAVPVEHPSVLIAAFGILWLALIGLVTWIWWYRIDDRRHDYRALAEALRVRQALAIAGSGQSVADAYLNQLRTELAWIRRALQHLCPPSEFWAEQFSELTTARKKERLDWVEVKWVQNQAKQHEHRRDEEHHLAGWYRRWSFRAALLGLVVLAVLPWIGPAWACFFSEPADARDEAAQGITKWLRPDRPVNALILLGTMSIVVGGVLVAVSERRGHEALAKQYDRMHAVFRAGHAEMKRIPTRPGADMRTAQRVIEELGREALQENAEWLLLSRSKPLELPLGV